MNTINLITPLENLRNNAEGRFSPLTGQRSDFIEGYLMAIDHAIELAKLQVCRQQEAK